MKKTMMVLVAMAVVAWAAAATAETISIKGPDGKTRYYDVNERDSMDGMKTYMTIRDRQTGEETQGIQRRGIWKNTIELRNTRTGETTEIDTGPDPDYFRFRP